MFRIAVPYGMLNSRQLRKLAHIAAYGDRGYGHFTTRHNMQFNWIPLERVCCAGRAGDGADACDPDFRQRCAQHHHWTTAGVAGDEIADPRPWCELIRQWSTFKLPGIRLLPRKFKIARTPQRPTAR